TAIDEAWQPRFSADDIALSPLGKVQAIANRLDTLAGGFAAGLKPTGNKDPFALRRNELGLAQTIIESGVDLPTFKLIESAMGRQPIQPSADATTETAHLELYEFILDRLRGYYADKGVPTHHFNAVEHRALHPLNTAMSLYDFDRRIDALGTLAQLPEA